MVDNEIVRVIFRGRPVFHGTRDSRTAQIIEGGWDVDEVNPWTIEWDSRTYDLFPGRDTFIPFAAMCSFFGDPRSAEKIQSYRDQHGRVGFIPDRATEIRRLRTKYGNMFGDETVVENYPLVEVYQLTGEPITTVLDDPAGRTTIAVSQTAAEHDDLLEIVKRQQLTINQLMETVGINKNQPQTPAPVPAPAPEPTLDGPPEDNASVSSEAATGERGGRPANEPALDFSTLKDSAVSYGPES